MRLFIALLLSSLFMATTRAGDLSVCLYPVIWPEADYADSDYRQQLIEAVRARLNTQEVALQVGQDCESDRATLVHFDAPLLDGRAVEFEYYGLRGSTVEGRLFALSPVLNAENGGVGRAIRTAPDAPELPALIAGMLLYDSEQPELALPHLLDAVEGGTPEAAFYAGNIALLQEDIPEAADLYGDAIDNAPSVGAAFDEAVNLAWVTLQLGEPDAALALMDAYVESDETSTAGLREALTARAQLHALNFDYDAAIADVDAAIDLYPNDPALYVLRGRMVLLLYEWDRVLADYDRALELDPDYPDAYYWRGLLYYTTVVDRDSALPDFERYLELAPNGPYTAEAAHYAEAIRAELAALEP